MVLKNQKRPNRLRRQTIRFVRSVRASPGLLENCGPSFFFFFFCFFCFFLFPSGTLIFPFGLLEQQQKGQLFSVGFLSSCGKLLVLFPFSFGSKEETVLGRVPVLWDKRRWRT